MDFARKQLEKYGWTDGKGLGKNENGIAEALKPKLKRSVTGIGHDAASDFTEHWWTQLYNKAASNVEVEDKNGQTKKIKTKDTDEFEITNSTWKIKKKKKKTDRKEEQYKDFFVRKAVLNNGEGELEKTENASDSDTDEDNVNKDVFKMTDEELFAACEGRTAHKGARHGLKATGKLARIAQQEQLLLTQSQYEGYSHAKRRKAEENLQNDLTNNSDDIKDSSGKKEKKKKKNNSDQAESVTSLPDGYEKKNSDSVASNDEKDVSSRKSNKLEDSEMVESVNDESVITKKKKKKRETEDLPEAINEEEEIVETVTEKKSKKKKKKHKQTSE